MKMIEEAVELLKEKKPKWVEHPILKTTNTIIEIGNTTYYPPDLDYEKEIKRITLPEDIFETQSPSLLTPVK